MSDKINRNIPASLKEFHSTLMEFQYKHDLSTVFNDFLSLNLQAWSREPFEGLNEQCQRLYTAKERERLGLLIKLHLQALQDGVSMNGWFDALGTYYEAFASNWKKGKLGQFFTPPAVCDLMTDTLNVMDRFNTIGEPACGSGRNILSIHARHPQNFYFAQDIDPMCVKMCAINMIQHGAQGVVYCMDTIKMSDFRFGFAVNVGVHFGDVPNVIICREQKLLDHYWRSFEAISRTCKVTAVEEPRPHYRAA